MADYNIGIPKTLKNEGGYVNDPKDSGGETYKGIARKKNSSWDGWVIVDSMRSQPNFPKNLITNKDLNAKINLFYKKNYWDVIRCDEIKSQEVAESLFDSGVNMGPVTAIHLIQRVLKYEETGKMDDKTLTTINSLGSSFKLS